MEIIYGGFTDTVFAIIANFTLFALYALAPMPTMWRISVKESTENFHPYPYLIAIINCFVLLEYALPLHNDGPIPFHCYCLSLSSSIGTVFLLFYNYNFCENTTQWNRAIVLSFGLVLLGIPGTRLYLLDSWFNGDANSTYMMVRERVVVPLTVVCGVLLHASPLTIIKTVYETKSVEYMPFWLNVACLFNGLMWVIYGWVSPIPSPHIIMANGVGLLLGAFQLRVFYKFYVNTHNFNLINFGRLVEVLRKLPLGKSLVVFIKSWFQEKDGFNSTTLPLLG